MGDVATVEGEGDEGTHALPALATGGAGIDDQHAQRSVGDDLEDVAMAANEDFGPRQLQP